MDFEKMTGWRSLSDLVHRENCLLSLRYSICTLIVYLGGVEIVWILINTGITRW